MEHLVETLCHSSPDLEPSALNHLLDQFSAEYEPYSLEPLLPTINNVFHLRRSLPEIFAELKRATHATDSMVASWAKRTLEQLESMSPTSLLATLELLRRGSRLSFRSCLAMEYNLAKNFLQKVPDLSTGITSKLINKETKTKWSPAMDEALQQQNTLIKELFAPNETVKDSIEFLVDRDFEQCPHISNTLPSINQIRDMVVPFCNLPDRKTLIHALCEASAWKMGLPELLGKVINTFVKTRTEMEAQGQYNVKQNLTWIYKEPYITTHL